MNLYRIWQDVNNGYGTYDSAVVAAKDEEAARNTVIYFRGEQFDWRDDEWCAPEHVQVALIGEAASGIEAGVILSSFNAG